MNESGIIFLRLLLYLSIVWDGKFTFLKIYRVSNIVSIFQFFVIHHICSWLHQGNNTDISLRSICRKIFLLWYSFMIHKVYFSLPSLAKRICSTGTAPPYGCGRRNDTEFIFVCFILRTRLLLLRRFLVANEQISYVALATGQYTNSLCLCSAIESSTSQHAWRPQWLKCCSKTKQLSHKIWHIGIK
jgi:hypothetical protein